MTNSTSHNETILEEAQRLVHGDRGLNYGHPLDNFEQTAALWTALFGKKLIMPLTAEEVGMAMICLKLSRQQNKSKRDNMCDAAGYAETVQMCVEERARRDSYSIPL